MATEIKELNSQPSSLTEEEQAILTATKEEEVALSKLFDQWEQEAKEPAPVEKKREEPIVIDEFENEAERWTPPPPPDAEPTPEKRRLSWKWILIGSGIASFFAIFSLFWVSTQYSIQSEVEEFRAASGLADLTMALTYAKVHHLKPENRNWGNHNFLKSNLHHVLASTYRPGISIPSQGTMSAGVYPVRLYTNNDLSHFVLIAQPPPPLFHFFSAPSAIALDSSSMKLHKIEDLRPLNRLLANPNPLDGVNGNEISHLIAQEKILRLGQMALETKHPDLTPPRGLPWISPGAENYVYNAPRYYKFCQSLLQKAVAYSVQEGEQRDRLEKEGEEFLPLPSFVFYSSQGKGAAILAQKALQKIFPDRVCNMGYLTFKPNGEIATAHLLKESGPRGHFLNDASETVPSSSNLLPESKGKTEEEAGEEEQIDTSDPLYQSLLNLARERKKILSEISEEWELLIEKDLDQAQVLFSEIQQDIFDTWNQARAEQEIKIRSALIHLQEKYSSVPFAHFEKLSHAAGLEAFLNIPKKEIDEEKTSQQNEELDAWLYRIQQSTNWEELAFRTKEASSYLKLQHFPHSEQLRRLQNRVRNRVIDRLDDFLFSRKYHLPHKYFSEDNHSVLEEIMKYAWITDQEEQNFYFEAFESLIGYG